MVDKPEAATRMRGLKVIGAGFGRTGTMSLKAALEELGFGPCYHMTELFDRPEDITRWEAAAQGETIDWHNLFAGYQATVDWPGCSFYEELMNAYPDAKVLLTIRDPESWYESVNSTIYAISRRASRIPFASLFFLLLGAKAPGRFRVGHMTKTLIWEGTFGGSFEDRQHAITVFNQHIEHVKKHVPSDRLLVYEVKEGWEPLCRFLGVEIPPDKPFPRLNERSDFVGNRFWQQDLRRLVRVPIAAGAVLVILLVLRRLLKQKVS